MPRYICKTKGCSLYKSEEARSTVLKIVDGLLMDTGAICPVCNKLCMALSEKGMTTNIRGGKNICTS